MPRPRGDGPRKESSLDPAYSDHLITLTALKTIEFSNGKWVFWRYKYWWVPARTPSQRRKATGLSFQQTHVFHWLSPLCWIFLPLIRIYWHNSPGKEIVENVVLHNLLSFSEELRELCITVATEVEMMKWRERQRRWGMSAKCPYPDLKHTQAFKCFTYLIL